MRHISEKSIASEISEIRIHVFEEIITQLTKSSTINFDTNIYLIRLKSLATAAKIATCAARIPQSEWQSIYIEYQQQCNCIQQGIVSIPAPKYRKYLYDFAVIIYEECLFSKEFWNLINKSKITKINFKKGISQYHFWSVCPYCDLERDYEMRSFEIDHMLPKVEYPLLAINEWNLVPCCKNCNSKAIGKGENYPSSHYNIFKHQIGDNVSFSLTTSPKIQSSDPIVQNFLSVLQIEKRINHPQLLDEITRLQKKIYRDLKANIDNRRDICERDTLYFIGRLMYDEAKRNIENDP